MATKTFEVSPDDLTWATIPGNDASVDFNGNQLDTTVFGSDFNSSIMGIIEHSFSGNAMFRKTAGYNGTIRGVGTATSFTDEPTTLTGGYYVIDDITKSIFDHNEIVLVEDDNVPVDPSNIAEIDYLFGKIKFVDTYTVVGNITVSGDYLPTATLGCFQSFDLTQSSDTIETGCFEGVKANGGYQSYKPTLRDVAVSASGFYQTDSTFIQTLIAREIIVIEIDIEGDGKSVCRGYFTLITDGLSGGTGGDETESLEFSLSVPEGVKPFSWYFAPDTNAPKGLVYIINAWENKTNVYYRYRPEGANGATYKAQAVITDCSISTSVDGIAEASVSGQGTGGVTFTAA